MREHRGLFCAPPRKNKGAAAGAERDGRSCHGGAISNFGGPGSLCDTRDAGRSPSQDSYISAPHSPSHSPDLDREELHVGVRSGEVVRELVSADAREDVAAREGEREPVSAETSPGDYGPPPPARPFCSPGVRLAHMLEEEFICRPRTVSAMAMLLI